MPSEIAIPLSWRRSSCRSTAPQRARWPRCRTCHERRLRPPPGAAAARSTGARRHAHRLDRRQRRCRRGHGRRAGGVQHRAARHVRRRRVHRLPRSPSVDGAARRRQHEADLPRHRAARRQGPRRQRRPHPVGPRARLAVAAVRCRGRRPVRAARRAPHGRPRRLPVRRPAHPAGTAVEHVAVATGQRVRAVPEELCRRARRDGRRARARAARSWHHRTRPVGPGAALRQLDVVPGCVGGAAHRAARDGRSGDRRCGDAHRSGTATAAARSARRRQRGAPGHGAPAGRALRHERAADAVARHRRHPQRRSDRGRVRGVPARSGRLSRRHRQRTTFADVHPSASMGRRWEART